MAFQSAAHNMGLEMDQRTGCNRKSHRSQPYIQPGQPREQICAKMEQKYVHDVYNKTAHHFADVRYKAWPKVKEFLMNQDPGSIVADVGCGNGKYLNINKEIIMIGCDHSVSLVSMAHDAGHSVLVCDNLYLPFRDHSFDAVISVGVIHHFTTPSRRAKAIQELSRVLRPGGKLMIYVWAMEQKHRKFKSQDVLVPWHLKLKYCKQAKNKKSQHKMKPSDVKQSLQEDSDEGDDDVFESENDLSMQPRPHSKKSRAAINKSKHFVPDEAFLMKFRERNPCLQKEQEKLLVHKYFNIRKKSAEPSVSNVSASLVNLTPSYLSKSECVGARRDRCKEDSLTQTIKMKFLNLLGVESQQTVSETRCSHIKMIEQIINSDHELSCQNGEIIPFYLAKEGFAVREFPGSSQRRELPVVKSTDTAVSRTETCDAGISTSDVDDSTMLVHNSGPATAPRQSDGEKVVTSHPKDVTAADVLDAEESHPKVKEVTNIRNCRSGHQGFGDICSEWLCYGSSKLGTLSEPVLSVSNCNIDNSGNPIISKSTFIETFPFAGHDDWVKLTTKAIEHVQSNVTARGKITSGVQAKSKMPSPSSSCTCRGNVRHSNHSVDLTKAKQSNTKSWNCSESSLSSISSDTDSNASDVEDVSLCMACRDSVSDVSQVEPVLGQNGNSLKQDLPQSNPDDLLGNGHTIGACRDGCRSDSIAKTLSNQHLVESTPDHLQEAAVIEDDKIDNVVQRVCPGGVDLCLDSIRSGQLSPASKQKSRKSKHIIPESSQRDVMVVSSRGLVNGLNVDTENGCSEVINHSLPQSSHNGISKTGATLGNTNSSDKPSIGGQVIHTDLSDQRQSTDDLVWAAESPQIADGHNTTTDGAHKRFYHVFKENELDELIVRRVHSLHIIQSFYDHANWCIIAEKLS